MRDGAALCNQRNYCNFRAVVWEGQVVEHVQVGVPEEV